MTRFVVEQLGIAGFLAGVGLVTFAAFGILAAAGAVLMIGGAITVLAATYAPGEEDLDADQADDTQ